METNISSKESKRTQSKETQTHQWSSFLHDFLINNTCVLPSGSLSRSWKVLVLGSLGPPDPTPFLRQRFFRNLSFNKSIKKSSTCVPPLCWGRFNENPYVKRHGSGDHLGPLMFYSAPIPVLCEVSAATESQGEAVGSVDECALSANEEKLATAIRDRRRVKHEGAWVVATPMGFYLGILMKSPPP